MKEEVKVIKKMDYLCKQTFFFGQRERFIKGKTYKGIPYQDDRTGEQRVEMYLRGTGFVYSFGEDSVYFNVLTPVNTDSNEDNEEVDIYKVEEEQIALDI